MTEPFNPPPKWISRLLEVLCKSELHEEILGDLQEFYQVWLNQHGTFMARSLYLWHAVKFLRLYALKNLIPKHQNKSHMINHHLQIAWRGILTRKGHGLINVAGLSLAFASSLIIYLWSYQEMQKDKFHQDSNRIFGIYSRSIFPEGIQALRNTPAKLPAELKEAIPEIEYATGFAKSFRLSLQGVTAETFQKGDVVLKMKGSRASPQFFNLFSFRVLQGNKENALSDPHAIAISRTMAEIFFGSPEAAIHESIRYQNKENLKVVLVFDDIGDESSLQFDYLTHWDTWVDGDEFKPFWGHFGTQTYVKLQEGVDPLIVEEKMKDFLNDYLSFDEGERIELGLQLFGEQYLYGDFGNGFPVAGRMNSVRFFLLVALFILTIAIINFVNLMTAKARERAKEVALRKVIGASRKDLIHQFFTEAILATVISAALGCLFARLTLPLMESISNTSLAFPFYELDFVLLLFAVVISTGVLAGAYPSWVLSRYGLAALMNRNGDQNAGLGLLRKGLVVFQFALSMFLMIGTITLTSQLDYLLNKNVGFDREHLIYIPIEGALVSEYQTFREAAVKVPGVSYVDRSSQTPHKMGFRGAFLNWEGKDSGNNTAFTPSSVGFDFVKTLGLEIIEGRDFDRARPADENNFLVNEAAAKVIGRDALNKTVSIFGKEGKIIGIFKDFHFNSLHSPIQPMVLDVKEGLNFGTVTIQLSSSQISTTLERLEELHNELNPGYAFDYTFVQEVFDDEYQSEQLVSSLVPYFSGLAILISCLGLFGLVTFALQRRVKELGIRKVLGASFTQLVNLLSMEFLVLLIVAAVLALPVSYIVLQYWLQGYAYSIELGVEIFASALVLSLAVAFFIILIKVAKSALTNPVDSLRSE